MSGPGPVSDQRLKWSRDPLHWFRRNESGWSCCSWLSCLQGRTPLEGRRGPVDEVERSSWVLYSQRQRSAKPWASATATADAAGASATVVAPGNAAAPSAVGSPTAPHRPGGCGGRPRLRSRGGTCRSGVPPGTSSAGAPRNRRARSPPPSPSGATSLAGTSCSRGPSGVHWLRSRRRAGARTSRQAIGRLLGSLIRLYGTGFMKPAGIR